MKHLELLVTWSTSFTMTATIIMNLSTTPSDTHYRMMSQAIIQTTIQSIPRNIIMQLSMPSLIIQLVTPRHTIWQVTSYHTTRLVMRHPTMQFPIMLLVTSCLTMQLFTTLHPITQHQLITTPFMRLIELSCLSSRKTFTVTRVRTQIGLTRLIQLISHRIKIIRHYSSRIVLNHQADRGLQVDPQGDHQEDHQENRDHLAKREEDAM